MNRNHAFQVGYFSLQSLSQYSELKLNQETLPLTEAYRLKLIGETLPLTEAFRIHTDIILILSRIITERLVHY